MLVKSYPSSRRVFEQFNLRQLIIKRHIKSGNVSVEPRSRSVYNFGHAPLKESLLDSVLGKSEGFSVGVARWLVLSRAAEQVGAGAMEEVVAL
jgi:hypothetical protein